MNKLTHRRLEKIESAVMPKGTAGTVASVKIRAGDRGHPFSGGNGDYLFRWENGAGERTSKAPAGGSWMLSLKMRKSRKRKYR